MNNIEVSVVMPVYNEEKFLSQAIESVCTQAGAAIEVLAIDDFSTDGTWELLQQLSSKFDNLKTVRGTTKGKCNAINQGVAMALGRFVCLFAGDDVMPAGSLAARYEVVKHTNDAQPVVGLSKLKFLSKRAKENGVVVPKRAGVGSTSGCSPMMNKSAVEIIFPVPTMLPNEDTWMSAAITFLPVMNIFHSDIVGTHYRIHEGNSMTVHVPFKTLNERFAQRMAAYELFATAFKTKLAERLPEVEAMVQCEKARLSGNPLSIMLTAAPIKDRLRAVFYSSNALFLIKQRLHYIFVGW